jgi:hypothetical protein
VLAVDPAKLQQYYANGMAAAGAATAMMIAIDSNAAGAPNETRRIGLCGNRKCAGSQIAAAHQTDRERQTGDRPDLKLR